MRCLPAFSLLASSGACLVCHPILILNLKGWVSRGEGQVVLLGDAAHAMPPNLGQGANQAIQVCACMVGQHEGQTSNDRNFSLCYLLMWSTPNRCFFIATIHAL